MQRKPLDKTDLVQNHIKFECTIERQKGGQSVGLTYYPMRGILAELEIKVEYSKFRSRIANCEVIADTIYELYLTYYDAEIQTEARNRPSYTKHSRRGQS